MPSIYFTLWSSFKWWICVSYTPYVTLMFSFLAHSKVSLSPVMFPCPPLSSASVVRCVMERSDHSVICRDRQQMYETRSIGNKTDNKSQICSLILSAVGSEDRKEREGGEEEIIYNSFSTSICLIPIFLFMLYISLHLHFFCVSLYFRTSFCLTAFSFFASKYLWIIIRFSFNAKCVEFLYFHLFYTPLFFHFCICLLFHLSISLYFHLSLPYFSFSPL